MRRGDFAAAFAVNDEVLAGRRGVPDDPRLPYHLRFVWDGRPFDGRRVLVRCYHGLGDTLQFARYLPALRRRAADVTLEVQPELAPLLAHADGADRVVPFDVDAPLKPEECDIEIMDLMHALRLPPSDMTLPGIAVPAEAIRDARERVGTGFTVGVCWRSGDWDGARSVPLAELLPALAGVRLVRLQSEPATSAPRRGEVVSRSPALPLREGLGEGSKLAWANPSDTISDMITTASLIASVDLVVTVDTMVAHLAGTLSRPTALLLKARADWRWQDRRTDSPWYPTMRLYRQECEGDWRAPLAQLAADLVRFGARA